MPEIVQQIGAILFLVCGLGLSVIIHEYFHMRAALLRGMKVERFAIGFGPKLASFRRGGVEYVVSMLPFGGYVLLPQMNPGEDGKARTEDGTEVPLARPGDRIVVALAGPIGNLVLAFIIACVIWQMGEEKSISPQGLQVRKLEESSPEKAAGLRDGDFILSCNGKKCKDINQLLEAYVFSPEMKLEVKRGDETIFIGPFIPKKNPDIENLKTMAFSLNQLLPPMVGEVGEGTPAAQAGLCKGDRLIAIDGHQLTWFHQIRETLNDSGDPGRTRSVTIERDGKRRDISVTPKLIKQPEAGMVFLKFPRLAHVDADSAADKAGIRKGDELVSVNGKACTDVDSVVANFKTLQNTEIKIEVKRDGKSLNFQFRPGSATAILGVSPPFQTLHREPFGQLSAVCVSSFNSLKALFTPKSGLGVEHLSGVVGMADAVYSTFVQVGLVGGLKMLLMINIALGMFNLLPFPVLDGGHILIAAAEIIGRRPVSPRLLMPVYNVFILLVIALMIFVLFNDVRRVNTKAYRVEMPTLHPKDPPC